jgi:hypothetical protein
MTLCLILIFQIEQGGPLPALDRDAADVIAVNEVRCGRHTVGPFATKIDLSVGVLKINFPRDKSIANDSKFEKEHSILHKVRQMILFG